MRVKGMYIYPLPKSYYEISSFEFKSEFRTQTGYCKNLLNLYPYIVIFVASDLSVLVYS